MCCCLMQRCEPFLNEMRVKWSLSFFSLNFSGTFKSIDWRQGVRIFFDFQRSFIDKVDVLECAFHVFYLKYYAFIMSSKNWQKCNPPTPATTRIQNKEAHSPISWILDNHIMISLHLPASNQKIFCLNCIFVHFF